MIDRVWWRQVTCWTFCSAERARKPFILTTSFLILPLDSQKLLYILEQPLCSPEHVLHFQNISKFSSRLLAAKRFDWVLFEHSESVTGKALDLEVKINIKQITVMLSYTSKIHTIEA